MTVDKREAREKGPAPLVPTPSQKEPPAKEKKGILRSLSFQVKFLLFFAIITIWTSSLEN